MPDKIDSSDEIARLGERLETPCGDGRLVWRRWGAGRPVVLVHGGSGSWTHWIKTIPALLDLCEIWAVDLPGLGDSAMPPKPWTPASSAAVLKTGLDELLGKDCSLNLVGFSFGAHVATLLAAALGRCVDTLVLIGSAALGLGWRGIELPKERSSMSPAERREIHRLTLERLMFAEPARIDELAIDLQIANVARARFRSRPFAVTDEVRRTLADVPAPLRAIWGEHDVVAQPSVEACYAALRLHHPELVTCTIAGAGHWVMYEAADAFNRALIDALRLKNPPQTTETSRSPTPST